MVKLKEKSLILEDGSINLESWLQHIAATYSTLDLSFIRQASSLSQLAGGHVATTTGISCLQQGLDMAEILLDLNLDHETIAAAIVYTTAQYADLNLEDVTEHLGDNIVKLIKGVDQMDALRTLQTHASKNRMQIENLRKMLLAMVEDVRVVLIKLAERLCVLRAVRNQNEAKRKQIAKEVMDIYAPLANRLGVGQIKWEMEDLSFRYLEPDSYKELASLLDERRVDRERYVENVVEQIRNSIQAAGVRHAEVQGRAKHIYSIYRKMKRKNLGYEQIYDISAVRVLVNSIEDCYAVLGIVHSLWQQIPQEFDDYVATPKENGYRSIHTAVIGPAGKNVEVQIRTFEMHQESELGVAAHWRYKEGGQQKSNYENKIAWLRQVLAWQKELAEPQTLSTDLQQDIFADRVYVFTPNNEIVDLPQGSTPLDFAYYIHSEVGHRCRGAKVNGTIVPLTYTLNTGEQIEILTTKHPNPSRDWLNPHLGYLTSSRAKAKVHHWFKLQDYDKNLAEGQELLEKELRRLDITHIDFQLVAEKLHYKLDNDLFAAIGSGDLRVVQITNLIQQMYAEPKTETDEVINIPTTPNYAISKQMPSGISIQGVGNLLTHTALCCKPVPGDQIVGFITIGRGVSIHRKDCSNIEHASKTANERIIDVSWGIDASELYPVTLAIQAYDRQGLVRDLTTILSNEKSNVIALNTTTNKTENIAYLTVTFEISNLERLEKILDRIQQLPNMISVKRQT